jgi:type I restriction enzyme S subunit
MFGDPVHNEKGWEKKSIKQHIGKVITGNTPSRTQNEFYNDKHIEWIKTDNILENKMFVTEAYEYLSELGMKSGRSINSGSLLVTCIAGSIKSIGTAALTNRKVAFNQQINAIKPFNDVSSYFLYWLFRICKRYIQRHATKGMKKIITKSKFEKILLIKPPLPFQNKFAQLVEKLEPIKSKYEASLTELENLYGSLSQRAFRGDLDLSKISVDVVVEREAPKTKSEILTPKVQAKTTRQFSEEELIRTVRECTGTSFNFRDLWGKLEEGPFEKLPEYDELRNMVFRMLEGESPHLSQVFDKGKKEIVFSVNI